jgi:nitrate reductase NapAB chaperone NapD
MDTATTIAPAAVEFSTEELEAALKAKGFKVKLTEVHEKEVKAEKTEAERLVEALALVAKVEVKEDGTAVIVILPTEEIEANEEAKLVMTALGEKSRTTMEKIEKARRLATYTGKPRGRKPGVKAEGTEGTEGTAPEGTEAPAA